MVFDIFKRNLHYKNIFMYNGYIIKKRSALTLLSATFTVRVMVVISLCYLRKPPYCFLRRGVVFLLCSNTCFRKIYATTSRTMPFKISNITARNISIIITSFLKIERSVTTNHPHNIQLPCYYIKNFQLNNLTFYTKKNRAVTGTSRFLSIICRLR